MARRRRAPVSDVMLLRFVAANEGRALLGWRSNPERLVKAGLIIGHEFFPDGLSMPPAYSDCSLTEAGRQKLANGEVA